MMINWKEIAKSMEKASSQLRKETHLLTAYLLPTYEEACVREYSHSEAVLPLSRWDGAD